MISQLIDEPYWTELEERLKELAKKQEYISVTRSVLPIDPLDKSVTEIAAKAFLDNFLIHKENVLFYMQKPLDHQHVLFRLESLIPIILKIVDLNKVKRTLISELAFKHSSKRVNATDEDLVNYGLENNIENLFVKSLKLSEKAKID